MILSHLCAKKINLQNMLQSLVIRRRNSGTNGNFSVYKILLCPFIYRKKEKLKLKKKSTYLFIISRFNLLLYFFIYCKAPLTKWKFSMFKV